MTAPAPVLVRIANHLRTRTGWRANATALGFGGNGITFSAIAAQLVARAILGIEDPDAGLFALEE